MKTVTQFIILIAFIIALLVIFHLYSHFLSKLSQNSIKKRLAKGKISDKQLIKFYKLSDKGRKNKWMAILIYGIYYKSYLKMQEGTYQIYRSEIENRGLLNEVS